MTAETHAGGRCGWGWVTPAATSSGVVGHVCSREPAHDGPDAGTLEHVCSCGAQAHSRKP